MKKYFSFIALFFLVASVCFAQGDFEKLQQEFEKMLKDPKNI
jgi:hypothetical protein